MKIIKLFKYVNIIFNVTAWRYFWNYWWAVQAMVSQKYERAISLFNRCLSLKKSEEIDNLIFEHLGKCYFGLNDIAKAKTYLLKSIEVRNPENINSEVSSRLGFIFYQEGDLDNARYYLEKAQQDYNKIDYTNIDVVNEYLIKIKKDNRIMGSDLDTRH